MLKLSTNLAERVRIIGIVRGIFNRTSEANSDYSPHLLGAAQSIDMVQYAVQLIDTVVADN